MNKLTLMDAYDLANSEKTNMSIKIGDRDVVIELNNEGHSVYLYNKEILEFIRYIIKKSKTGE